MTQVAEIPITSPITATGATGPLLADSDVDTLAISIPVSAVSGTTPSCTFTAEWAEQGTGYSSPSWDSGSAVSASALTAAGTATISLPANIADSGEPATWWRLSWTVSGTTPSFTIGTATATG